MLFSEVYSRPQNISTMRLVLRRWLEPAAGPRARGRGPVWGEHFGHTKGLRYRFIDGAPGVGIPVPHGSVGETALQNAARNGPSEFS